MLFNVCATEQIYVRWIHVTLRLHAIVTVHLCDPKVTDEPR